MTIPQDTPASQFQFVPVPNEQVPAVYRLLAELAATSARTGAGTETALRVGSTDDWTDEQLQRLARGDATSTQALTDIMDFLSKHPGEWFSQESLVEATGRTRGQLLVVWTKLTPHFEKHYNTAAWPLNAERGDLLTPPRPSTAHYSVTPARAEQWKRIRGN
ncbi:hypothetical protein [Leifsonia sp. Leaf264]|uniref:hypothetical protein n=1 Tax=Leifsonia sp. Leaf264 TaxID=1736314 RepID=UPI0006F1D9A3|nr:hypothetical protein [Leifsonia sp. Leaf264]KQP01404.1 hypothetical protein ASF30_01960 [Leifsonia sp. Leaf264]